MKQVVLAGMVALGALAFSQPAHAVVCANGVYRAGCAGAHGAAVVPSRPPPQSNAPKGFIGPDASAPMGAPRSSAGRTSGARRLVLTRQQATARQERLPPRRRDPGQAG